MRAELETTRISAIAERVGAGWVSLGAEVCYYDPHDAQVHAVTECPARLSQSADSLARAFEQCESIAFAGGRGLAVPLVPTTGCIGSVCCVLPADLSDRCQALLNMFQDQVAQAQRLAENEAELLTMSEQLARCYEELSLIYKLGKDLRVTESRRDYFQRYGRDMLEIIQARTLMMLVHSPELGGPAVLLAGEPIVSRERAEAIGRFFLRDGSVGPGPTFLPDLSEHGELARLFGQTDHNVIAVPLGSSRAVVGTIVAVDKDGRDTFDSADVKLLDCVAEQAASFLQNRRLVEDLNDLVVAVLASLVSTIDAKDPYTCGHSRRVAYLAREIAEALQLATRETTEVYLAGLLHDIGKIGVEDAVLSKPGTLTAEEYDKIKQHPVIGARIISGIKQLRGIVAGVLHHHERYDGSGYPHGLREDQIPLMGSIVALADCFDALTSQRTYRDALAPHEALAKVRHLACRQFSPMVVDALTQCPLEKLEHELKQISTGHDIHERIPAIDWLSGS